MDDRGSCHGCRILFRQHRARRGECNDSCAIFRRLPATGLLKMPGRAGSPRVQAERSRVRCRTTNWWRRPDHHSRRRNEPADKRFADRDPTQLNSQRPMNRFRTRRCWRWRCKSSRHPGFIRVCAGSMMRLRFTERGAIRQAVETAVANIAGVAAMTGQSMPRRNPVRRHTLRPARTTQ